MAVAVKGGVSAELERAEEEAIRFLKSCTALRERLAKDEEASKYAYFIGRKETAAVKRASLDLSRALSELRRS